MRLALLALALAGCTLDGGEGPGPGVSSAECGSCHPAQQEELAASRHAMSGSSPVFEAMLPRVREAWGEGAEARCIGCHRPAHAEEAQVTCVSCHAAVGNHRTADGALVIDPSLPIAGPFGDTTEPHASRPGGFLAAPELCGTCHQVEGPELFFEPTFEEYLASPAGEAGLGCVACHMPSLPAAPIALDAPAARRRRSHRFTGIDPSPADPGGEASARLLADALTLTVEPDGDGFTVALTNTGAGHAVPTGLGLLRDTWVDLVVDGEPRSRVIELGHRLMRGAEPVALPTDADMATPRALAPGESVTVRVPGERVEAFLRARAIRHDALDALALPHDLAPTLQVAAAP